ncbi:MAG: formylglycine-generating enzyme family protein [Candidatus Electrothrix communis]|nr:MAG: formylglycine-generating enzyme family protein [Candidatus Electrothrix communis]
MKRLKTQVSRADLLRLLAVSRTASAEAAAKLLGYLPAQGIPQAEQKKITRSSIASHARSDRALTSVLRLADAKEISRNLPLEAFWYLSERKPLKKTLHRFTAPPESVSPGGKRSILPGVLHKVSPLSIEELSVPEFIPCPSKADESNDADDSRPYYRKEQASLFSCAAPPDQKKDQDRSQGLPVLESDMEHLVDSCSEWASFPQKRINQKRKAAAKKKTGERKTLQSHLRAHLRLRRLLGLLSITAYVEPALLQEIVRLLPSSIPDIATEAALQSHPDIERDSRMYLALRPEKKMTYSYVFAHESSPLQAEILGLLRQRDATRAPLLFALELLPVLPLLHSAHMQKQIAVWLEAFMMRFVRTWFEGQEDNRLTKQAGQLLDLVEMLPKELKKQFAARSFLYGIVHRNALRTGTLLPSGYDPEAVIQTVRKEVSPISYQVLQQGEQLFLYPSAEAALSRLPGSVLVELELSVDCLLLHKEGYTATLPLRPGELLHDCRSQAEAFFVQTPAEQLVFGSCFRPSWAQTMGRNKKGLFVDASWLGKSYRLTWENSMSQGPGKWSGSGDLQTDQYGLFVDLQIKDTTVQRFRRIIPGWFMMGSPDDEPQRESWGKEALHEVILTKGFWVADTAVTQGLWQAVIGDNPSRFKGTDHPVEQVSYHDALLFLERLNELVPGVKARLLTEAEWEYCCRAGSATPFSFGARITPDQVNYNGQYPYHTGLMGENRQQTVAVKSLPCNDWGLHEMHGNIWEWCQDHWQENLFSEEPRINPQGPGNGEFQVVRGGSWFLGGRGVRSAVRGKFAPHFRNSRIGFRIALTPAEEAARVPGPALQEKKAGISTSHISSANRLRNILNRLRGASQSLFRK